jgi:hypothetical protein
LVLAIPVAISLIGCNGSSFLYDNITDDNSSEEISLLDVSLSGKVIDGYISGATVFIDLNGNLEHESSEPSAISDENGTYSFQEELPEGKYKVVATGGVDITTNRDFNGTFTSVLEVYENLEEESLIISPATTLIANIYFSEDIDLESAEDRVAEELGLDISINILNTDFVAEISENSDWTLFNANQNALFQLSTSSSYTEQTQVEESADMESDDTSVPTEELSILEQMRIAQENTMEKIDTFLANGGTVSPLIPMPPMVEMTIATRFEELLDSATGDGEEILSRLETVVDTETGEFQNEELQDMLSLAKKVDSEMEDIKELSVVVSDSFDEFNISFLDTEFENINDIPVETTLQNGDVVSTSINENIVSISITNENGTDLSGEVQFELDEDGNILSEENTTVSGIFISENGTFSGTMSQNSETLEVDVNISSSEHEISISGKGTLEKQVLPPEVSLENQNTPPMLPTDAEESNNFEISSMVGEIRVDDTYMATSMSKDGDITLLKNTIFQTEDLNVSVESITAVPTTISSYSVAVVGRAVQADTPPMPPVFTTSNPNEGIEEDEVSEDEVSEDEVSEDEVSEDEVSEDENATKEEVEESDPEETKVSESSEEVGVSVSNRVDTVNISISIPDASVPEEYTEVVDTYIEEYSNEAGVETVTTYSIGGTTFSGVEIVYVTESGNIVRGSGSSNVQDEVVNGDFEVNSNGKTATMQIRTSGDLKVVTIKTSEFSVEKVTDGDISYITLSFTDGYEVIVKNDGETRTYVDTLGGYLVK